MAEQLHTYEPRIQLGGILSVSVQRVQDIRESHRRELQQARQRTQRDEAYHNHPTEQDVRSAQQAYSEYHDLSSVRFLRRGVQITVFGRTITKDLLPIRLK